MPKEEEILDTFTRDGEYLGVKTRSECHSENPGFYHKPVWIWIMNDDGQILVQKRSKFKRKFPGYWDIPSAGHLNAGEDPIEGAIRETKEELGIDAKPVDFKYIGEHISDVSWELGQVYLLKVNVRTDDMVFQGEEVEGAEWLPFEKFEKLLYSDSFVPYDDEFKKMTIDLVKRENK